jgi:hypothetical protein
VRSENSIEIIPQSIQRDVQAALELYLKWYSVKWKQHSNHISIFTARCESSIRIIPQIVQRKMKTLKLYLNRYSAKWKKTWKLYLSILVFKQLVFLLGISKVQKFEALFLCRWNSNRASYSSQRWSKSMETLHRWLFKHVYVIVHSN